MEQAETRGKRRFEFGKIESPEMKFLKVVTWINTLRSMGEEEAEYQYEVNRAGDILKEIFKTWLTEKGYHKDLDAYLLLVQPYLNYTFYSAQTRRKIRLFPVPRVRKERFIRAMIEDFFGLDQDAHLELILKAQFKVFSRFLEMVHNKNFQ